MTLWRRREEATNEEKMAGRIHGTGWTVEKNIVFFLRQSVAADGLVVVC